MKHLLIKIRQKINFTCPQVAISHFLWFLSPCDSTFFMISQSSSQRHSTVMRLCLNFDILNQKRHRVNHKQVQVQTLLLRLPKETSEFVFWFAFFFLHFHWLLLIIFTSHTGTVYGFFAKLCNTCYNGLERTQARYFCKGSNIVHFYQHDFYILDSPWV